MRNDLFRRIATLFFALSAIFSPHLAFYAQAQETVTTTAETAVTRPQTAISAIQRAKVLLGERLKQRAAEEKQPYVVPAAPSVVSIVLAVWDRDTDEIVLVDAEKSGAQLSVKPPSTLKIKVSYSNKIYSQYELPKEENALVVGVVYPVFRQVTVNKKRAYEGHDVVYVPYMKDFFTPDVLSAGSDYLSYLIQDAFDELRAKGIRSRAFPDKLVADVIDPYLIKSIVVIEHTDHASLLREDNPERTLGIFLAKLALNGDDAFGETRSVAGAGGLVQFIPKTYALFVNGRPDLELIPDFAKGMADHRNAVKAEVAYLDDSLRALPKEVRDLYVKDKVKAAEFLAAAYNGGTGRVKKAIAAFGDEWANAVPMAAARAEYDRLIDRGEAVKAKMRKADGKTLAKLQAELEDIRRTYRPIKARIAQYESSALRTETVNYVAKLRRTYGMFTAGMFATPNAPSGALPNQTAAQPAPVQPGPLALAPQICFADGGCVAPN
jgi:hypothetical protein